MRTLGLLGGMSWESTLPYYREINQYTRQRRGGLHSAPLLLDSVDFDGIARMQREGDWDAAGALLAARARALQGAGAEALLLCTNTMHKVAAAIRDAGIDEVGLLATAFTMEQDFYRGRMARQHGIRVHVPDAAGRAEVHRIIYEELCQGRILADSRERYRRIIGELVAAGAKGLILGCTEVGLLIDASDSPVSVFDSCALHARAAVDWALDGMEGAA
jgi:aspartate racemase